jgi:peptidoglycan/LPS O-acetylase OafA/YrhL
MVALWLRWARPKRGTLLVVGLVLLAGSLAYFLTHVPEAISFRYGSPFVFTNVALLSTSLLLIALVSENTGRLVHRFFFMSGWLSFLGFISYGLYLFHFFFTRAAIAPPVVARFDRWHHPYFTQWALELAAIAFSILLAWISRVTLERAALSKKGMFG